MSNHGKPLGPELEELGTRLGLPDLEWDDDLVCSLKIGDDFFMTMAVEPKRGLTLYTVVGQFPEEVCPVIYREIASANLLWRDTEGATLSADPDSGTVFLARAQPTETVTADQWYSDLQDFLRVTRFWRDRFVQLTEGPAPEAPAPTPSAKNRMFA